MGPYVFALARLNYEFFSEIYILWWIYLYSLCTNNSLVIKHGLLRSLHYMIFPKQPFSSGISQPAMLDDTAV